MPSVLNQVTIDLSATIQDQHRDRLEQMQLALDSLHNLHRQPVNSFTCSQLEVLVKQIVQDACTVPDSFFLSDACEAVHELFADFKILLGYFETEKTHGDRFEMCYQDVVEDCAGLVRLYRNFLRDPGYVGTAFPKPDKIKAMRRMSRVMSVSVEMESQHSTIISIPEPTMVQPRSHSLVAPSSRNSLGSLGSLPIKTPATPLLKPQNLATSALLEAVKQVMPTPPPVPARPHPSAASRKLTLDAPKSALEAINLNLLQTRLRPPTFVDEEGDELPHTPPPQISPVLSDSDSFMTAFREYAKKQKEQRRKSVI